MSLFRNLRIIARRGTSVSSFIASACKSNFRIGGNRAFSVSLSNSNFQIVSALRSQPRPRPRPRPRWLWYSMNALKVVVFGSGVSLGVYHANSETVPFTNRTQFGLMNIYTERSEGSLEFLMEKQSLDSRKFLPRDHPHCVRARFVTKNIVQALPTELIRKRYLDPLNLEVLVVDEPRKYYASCFPGGKVIVYTGLLRYCKTDAELATVIGHEIAHLLARHSAETIAKTTEFSLVKLWFVFTRFLLRDFSLDVAIMEDLLLRLPLSRKLEAEADYIGLLLMASAGYDPRVAPALWLRRYSRQSIKEAYHHSHPTSKKRAELLTQPQVMEEALTIYNQVRPARDVSRNLSLHWRVREFLKFLRDGKPKSWKNCGYRSSVVRGHLYRI